MLGFLLSALDFRKPDAACENVQTLSTMSSRQIFADSQAADLLEQVLKHHCPPIE
jgi:hypothetical protein